MKGGKKGEGTEEDYTFLFKGEEASFRLIFPGRRLIDSRESV